MKMISDETHKLLDELAESIIREWNLDKELIRDCFPLKEPYRNQASEALLTVETRMRKILKLHSSRVGVDIIDDALRLGVFKRSVLKIILFSDYLIKLFEDQCKENKIKI
jgi:hypothetical protein